MCHCGFCCFSSAFSECFLTSLLVSVHPSCIHTKPNNRMSVCFLRLSLASYLSFSLHWDSKIGLTLQGGSSPTARMRSWRAERENECDVVMRRTRYEKALCGRWCVGSVLSTKRLKRVHENLEIVESTPFLFGLRCPNSAIPWNCLWIV